MDGGEHESGGVIVSGIVDGPLFNAVSDEWERGKVIADRAGINPRTGGPRLAALVRGGSVIERQAESDTVAGRVKLYRRSHSEADG